MLPELTCVELPDIILIAIKGIHLIVIGDFSHIFSLSLALDCVYFIIATPRFVADLPRTFLEILGACVWGQKPPGLPLLLKCTWHFICLDLHQNYIYTCIFFCFFAFMFLLCVIVFIYLLTVF